MNKIVKVLIFIVTLLMLFGCNNKPTFNSNLKGADKKDEVKKDFERDGWLFFVNKSDGNKIYKIKRDSDKLERINDDNSIILKLDGNFIIYINNSDNSNLYKIRTNGLEKSKVENTFRDDCWIYFNTFTQIFKVKIDGTGLTVIYSRETSGSEMRITKVNSGYVYFQITSEDGISTERVKVDGTGYEHISQISVDE